MTNASRIIASAPATAWVASYYGGRKIASEWNVAGMDRSVIATRDAASYAAELRELSTTTSDRDAASVLAVLPALDDEAGWTALDVALRAELYSDGQTEAQTCGAIIAPLLPTARFAGRTVCIAADRTVGWLNARGFGQEGPQLLPAEVFA